MKEQKVPYVILVGNKIDLRTQNSLNEVPDEEAIVNSNISGNSL